MSEKIKLILNELENKKQHKLQKKECPETEEMSKEELRQDIIMHAVMSVAFLLATLALIRGIARVLPNSVTVSNTVNGRELPIYCVETDKKQIALSFDAA